MTFDSIARYTDESIKCLKEYQKFMQQKSQLEAEFAQKMVKLCQSALQQFNVNPIVGGGAAGAKTSKSEEKNQVLKTSLWQTFHDVLQQLHDNAVAMRTVTGNVETEVVTPFTAYIKDMESNRKAMVDEGVKQTNLLQETYVALKKAKQGHDDALSSYNEIKETHLKISRMPNTKEKEMDKWNQKLQQAGDKVAAMDAIFKQCDDICKSAQTKYWQQTIPDILQRLYTKEEERCLMVNESFKNWVFIDKQWHEFLLRTSDYVSSKIDATDLTSDMEELFTEHMNAIEGDDASAKAGGAMPSISVRSLVNPIKAGRVQKKSDENDSIWKARYFVLMGDRNDPSDANYQAGSGRLYYFESEDALKPKGIIDLAVASLYAVDDSLFPDRQWIFVISTVTTTTENNQLVTKQKHFYLSAESAEERDAWIDAVKRYALCCIPCVTSSLAEPVTLNIDSTENVVVNFPKANPREYYYRTIKSVRVWIMEAKELNNLDPALAATLSPNQEQAAAESFFPLVPRQVFSPFCTINVNDVRIAKTTVKTATNPFWGEEFFFDKITECESEFKIVVRAQTKRKDVELGFVGLKLSQFADLTGVNRIGKKWDGWLPLEGNKKDPEAGGSPGIRISVLVNEESILPLYEYPIFVNCLFSDDYQILKTLAKSAERCTSFARDDFARSLVHVLVATQSDIPSIRALLFVDVDATDDPNIIFRGNSLATKTIDQYMKFVGGEYLKNTLSGLIRLVYEKANKQESCEVDPTRIEGPSDEILKKHQKRLLSWVQSFWDTIQNSVEKSPRNLREALQSIREMVVKQFSSKISKNEKETANIMQVQYSAVSGFIFLRFLCPAILSPKLFGLWPEISENAIASRTLTLIAKVIQNLANLSDFKGKEPHMEFCNQWILWNMDAMKTCIKHFSSVTLQENQANESRYAFLTEHLGKIDLSRELNSLYLQITNNINDLKSQYDELTGKTANTSTPENEAQAKQQAAALYKRIDPQFLKQLFDYLEQMGSMYSRYDTSWKHNKEIISACAHLQKQMKILILNSVKNTSAPPPAVADLMAALPISSGTPVNYNSADGSSTVKDKKRVISLKAPTTKFMISTPTLVNSSNADVIGTPDRSMEFVHEFDTEEVSKESNSSEHTLSVNSPTSPTQFHTPSSLSPITVSGPSKTATNRLPPPIPQFKRRASLAPTEVTESRPRGASLSQVDLSPGGLGLGDEVEAALQQRLANPGGSQTAGSPKSSGSVAKPPVPPMRTLSVPADQLAVGTGSDDPSTTDSNGNMPKMAKGKTIGKKLFGKIFKKGPTSGAEGGEEDSEPSAYSTPELDKKSARSSGYHQ